MLELHCDHRTYANLGAFMPDLLALLGATAARNDAVELTRLLGLIEPLTHTYVPPEEIEIAGPNYRESLRARGLIARQRAMLYLLQQHYPEGIAGLRVYAPEQVTPFALRLQELTDGAMGSEYLPDPGDPRRNLVRHEDLCALSFAEDSFDLVLCSELFEHVYDLQQALAECVRVLVPGGRMLATFPLAMNQQETIIKAHGSAGEEPRLLTTAEFHGDPMNPKQGSLVYRVPGWEILDQCRQAGFGQAQMHYLASWKYGIVAMDIPGILVLEAKV